MGHLSRRTFIWIRSTKNKQWSIKEDLSKGNQRAYILYIIYITKCYTIYDLDLVLFLFQMITKVWFWWSLSTFAYSHLLTQMILHKTFLILFMYSHFNNKALQRTSRLTTSHLHQLQHIRSILCLVIESVIYFHPGFLCGSFPDQITRESNHIGLGPFLHYKRVLLFQLSNNSLSF